MARLVTYNGQRVTLARAHYLRTLAGDTGPAAASRRSEAQELMMAALWQDKRELKAIKSTAEKVRRKRLMLGKYYPYCEGVLAGDKGGEDPVLMTVLIWGIDAHQFEFALALAGYALRHDLKAPDQYARDTPAIVAEQIAEEVLLILAAPDADGNDDPPEWTPSDLAGFCEQAAMLTADHDMHDAIRAKLSKAHGYALRAIGDDEAAVNVLRHALSVHPRIGVKKDVERLEARIRKAASAETESATAAPRGSVSESAGAVLPPPDS